MVNILPQLSWWIDGKESACNVGDLASAPGLGRPPGEGKGYPTPLFWLREFHG